MIFVAIQVNICTSPGLYNTRGTMECLWGSGGLHTMSGITRQVTCTQTCRYFNTWKCHQHLPGSFILNTGNPQVTTYLQITGQSPVLTACRVLHEYGSELWHTAVYNIPIPVLW